MKKSAGVVGAGFKPAQDVSGTNRDNFRCRAGFKPAPTKPCFVVTLVMFFTLTVMARATPNDEKSAGIRRGGFQARPAVGNWPDSYQKRLGRV